MFTKKIIERVVLSFLVLSFSCLFISAEDIIREGASPSFEVINRESGLSNLSVSAIVQDRDGFLWFGTQGGLNRYDGREFKLYSHDPFKATGLLHNLIQTLFYDEQTHTLSAWQEDSLLLAFHSHVVRAKVGDELLAPPMSFFE